MRKNSPSKKLKIIDSPSKIKSLYRSRKVLNEAQCCLNPLWSYKHKIFFEFPHILSYRCFAVSDCWLHNLLATHNINVSVKNQCSFPISYQFHLEFNLRTSFVGGFSAGLAALSHSKFYAKVHLIVGFISVADISCYICITILYKVINRIHGHHCRRKFRILKTNATSLIRKLTISFINN